MALQVLRLYRGRVRISSLTPIEKRTFERLFGMGSGYALNFAEVLVLEMLSRWWRRRGAGRARFADAYGRPVRQIGSVLAVVVVLASVPTHAVAQERWRLEEQLRIGAVDGPDALSQVGDLITSGDGRLLFVAQPQEYGIRVLDVRTGALIRTIGRRGGGPGEFSRVGSLSIRGDSLFAADAFQSRMIILSGEGEDLGTFKVVSQPLSETRRPPAPSRVTPSGDLWARSPLPMAAVANGQIQESPLVILGRDGTVVRRIASTPLAGTMSVVKWGNAGVMFQQPFKNPGAAIGTASDGSAAVIVELPDEQREGHRFSVTRIRHTGDTVYSRSYSFRPQPVPPHLRDSVLTSYATTMFARAGRRAPDLAREHIFIPQVQQPVTDVLVDTGSRTWIRREILRPRPRWVVLDAGGGLEGLVETPPGVELKHVAGDMVWAVVRDEMDVPYIVKYRIMRDRASGGGG